MNQTLLTKQCHPLRVFGVQYARAVSSGQTNVYSDKCNGRKTRKWNSSDLFLQMCVLYEVHTQAHVLSMPCFKGAGMRTEPTIICIFHANGSLICKIKWITQVLDGMKEQSPTWSRATGATNWSIFPLSICPKFSRCLQPRKTRIHNMKDLRGIDKHLPLWTRHVILGKLFYSYGA
jgi:hypothetical protein